MQLTSLHNPTTQPAEHVIIQIQNTNSAADSVDTRSLTATPRLNIPLVFSSLLLLSGGILTTAVNLKANRLSRESRSYPIDNQEMANHLRRQIIKLARQPGDCSTSYGSPAPKQATTNASGGESWIPACETEDKICSYDPRLGENPDCNPSAIPSARQQERLKLFHQLRRLPMKSIDEARYTARSIDKRTAALQWRVFGNGAGILTSLFGIFFTANIYSSMQANQKKTKFLDSSLMNILNKIQIREQDGFKNGLKIVSDFLQQFFNEGVGGNFENHLLDKIKDILMADVPETISANLPHELLMKYNIIQAMNSAMQNCQANRRHAANLLYIILNNAIDPETESSKNMKQRVMNGIVFSTAEALVRHVQEGDNVHGVVNNLNYCIRILVEHFKLNPINDLPYTSDAAGFNARDKAKIIEFLQPNPNSHTPSLANRFSGQGLVEQFLESDIWLAHINHHFADLISKIKEDLRESIDYSDTSEEGLAKLASIDVEEKIKIYAMQSTATALYLESGNEILPSIEAVQKKTNESIFS